MVGLIKRPHSDGILTGPHTGSQAKNVALMQLIANTCSVPVILPHSPSAAVVLGAAMLGRFAAEVSALGRELSNDEQRRKLWSIMVRCIACVASVTFSEADIQNFSGGNDTAWPTCQAVSLTARTKVTRGEV